MADAPQCPQGCPPDRPIIRRTSVRHRANPRLGRLAHNRLIGPGSVRSHPTFADGCILNNKFRLLGGRCAW